MLRFVDCRWEVWCTFSQRTHFAHGLRDHWSETSRSNVIGFSANQIVWRHAQNDEIAVGIVAYTVSIGYNWTVAHKSITWCGYLNIMMRVKRCVNVYLYSIQNNIKTSLRNYFESILIILKLLIRIIQNIENNFMMYHWLIYQFYWKAQLYFRIYKTLNSLLN